MSALHFSLLKWIATSPAHYAHAVAHPFEPTPQMRLGTLVHRLALGGPEPNAGPAPVVYDGKRLGNAWKAFKEAHPGVEIITIKEQERAIAEAAAERAEAQRIADAVLADRRVQDILKDAKTEVAIAETLHGRSVEGRADILSPFGVYDLKTTRDAHPDRFVWQARRMNYDTQVTWYGDIATAMKLAIGPKRGLIAVETRAPYCVTVTELTPELVELCRRRYIGWLEQLAVCEASNVWPGYSEAVLSMGPMETDVDFEFEEAAE